MTGLEPGLCRPPDFSILAAWDRLDEMDQCFVLGWLGSCGRMEDALRALAQKRADDAAEAAAQPCPDTSGSSNLFLG